ncbi:MAG: SDR family NAD(P)-dependent oxidoreductase [Thermaerobacter sp.]|nr:SDR family NAD(P)-dependent oxidoreductase [Thermaerobacter sp.]
MQTVAFVTNVDHPWGKAVAEELLVQGCRLVVNSPEGRSGPSGAMALQTRLDDPSRVEQAAVAIASALGPVDVLIHTDQVVERTTLRSCDPALVDRQLQANLYTAFWCTQVFGHRMAQRRKGHLLYVSSIHDEKPTGSAALYAMAKGALKMLAHEAAVALGAAGVRVNLLELGAMAGDDAQFGAGISPLYENFAHKVIGREPGPLTKVGAAVAGLLSDEVDFIHGADVRVDGGLLLYYGDAP